MKHLLLSAQHEILSLRHRNEILQAKVDVMELFAHAFHARVAPQGMSVDVAWELQQAIDKMPEEKTKQAETGTGSDPLRHASDPALRSAAGFRIGDGIPAIG